jgi:hypothetical protein
VAKLEESVCKAFFRSDRFRVFCAFRGSWPCSKTTDTTTKGTKYTKIVCGSKCRDDRVGLAYFSAAVASRAEGCCERTAFTLRFHVKPQDAVTSAVLLFELTEMDFQMHRHILSAISLVSLCCTSLTADDYLLRLETRGFRDLPQNEKPPAQQILESIEIVARINQPFYSNSTIGSAKISIKGLVEKLKDGRFRAQIQYRRSSDSGESITGPNGLRIPITTSTNINTTTIIEIQKPAELGNEDGITRTRDGTELKTKTQSVLSLVKFDPAND